MRADKGALGISLLTASAVIERHPGLPDAEERAEAELAATLARPRADARSPGLLGSAMTGSNWDFILGAADERSKEDYENEVRRYGELYKRAIQEQAVWRLWRHEPICLALEMVNLTEDNFAHIEIEVHVPGDVRTWPEEIEDIAKGPKPKLPDRPAVLGTRTPYGLPRLNFDPTFGVRSPSVYLPPPSVRGAPTSLRATVDQSRSTSEASICGLTSERSFLRFACSSPHPKVRCSTALGGRRQAMLAASSKEASL